MFLKPFRIKSNSECKQGEKHRLKREICSTYSSLSRRDVDNLIPNSAPLTVICLVTYGKLVVTTYHVEREPMFFEHEGKLVPSVYTLWKHPNMLRKIVLDLPAMGRFKNGADLLLSGIKTQPEEGGVKLDGLKANEYVSVLFRDAGGLSNGVAISVASKTEIERDFSGRGFKVLQAHGDLLWEMGSMLTPLNPNSTCLSSPDSSSSPAIPRDMSRSSVKEKDPPFPPSVSSVIEMFEDLRILAEAAQRFRDMPLDKEKMAFLLSLEEKARQMGIDHTSVSTDDVQPTLLKPVVKAKHDAMKSLSIDSSDTRYRMAHQLLDNADDDTDEIGVSIPDDYESSEEKKVGVAEPKTSKVKGASLEGKPVKDGSSKSERKRAKKAERAKGDSRGHEAAGKGLVKGERVGRLAVEEYEDHLRKVEEEMRHSGKDLSTEGSGLSALLAEFRKNLMEGLKKEETAKERKDESDSRSKQEECLVSSEEEKDEEEEEDESGSSEGGEDSGVMGDLPGMGGDLYEEEEDDEDLDYTLASGPEEEKALEGGVASSWYPISEMPAGGGAVGGVASILENQVQEMDDLLRECFFLALKAVRSAHVTMPLLTSTLYRVYMVEACPSELRLDVKKSSYKKVSKFLATMQSKGVITLKETEKGSDVISEIDFKHPLVRNFNPSLVRSTEEAATAAPAPTKSIKIVQLYSPSSRQLPFFKILSFSKSSLLEYSQVRDAIATFVRNHGLADSENKALVIPNPVLTDAIGPTGSLFVNGISRTDLLKMVLEQMRRAYSITYGRGPPVVRRGNLEPVRLTLAQRMGNKKVTLIDNLEVYGIPAADVAHSLQKVAAASTTVTDVPGKSGAKQVLVQGTAVKTVVKLLEESYGLPTKHIEAITKIKPPKATKKRKKKK